MNLREKILRYAVQCAKHPGQLMQFTREQVAAGCQCSEANVSYHFGTMENLRLAVIDFAVEGEVLEVLAQARAVRHKALIGRLSPRLKARVVEHMLK